VRVFCPVNGSLGEPGVNQDRLRFDPLQKRIPHPDYDPRRGLVPGVP